MDGYAVVTILHIEGGPELNYWGCFSSMKVNNIKVFVEGKIGATNYYEEVWIMSSKESH